MTVTLSRSREAPAVVARVAALAARFQTPIAVLVIAGAAVVVGWRPLLHGGLFFDDWWIRALALYDGGPDRNGFFGWWDGIYSISQYRPLAVPYFMVHVGVTDFDPLRYQLWGCGMSALNGIVLYATLRVARLPWLFACAAGLVFVTLPFAATAKYWSSISVAYFSNILFLAGLILGGLALRAWPQRRWGLLGGSLAFFAATASLYELVLPLLAVAPVYYAAAQGRFDRAVLVKTAADIGAAGVTLGIFRTQGRTDTYPVDQWWGHAWDIVTQAKTMFLDALVPEGRWRVALFAIVIVIAAGLVVRLVTERRAALDDLRASSRRLVLLAGVAVLGLVAALAGYLLLVPDLWYLPLQPGQGDRSNTAAVLGYSVTYTALAGILATLAMSAVRKRWAPVAGIGAMVALVLVMSGAFAADSRGKGDQYIAQWERSRELYRGIDATLRTPPKPGTLVLSFGSPYYVAPLVHVIGDWADFDAAVKLATGTGSVRGAAIFQTQPVVCGATGIELPPAPGGPNLGTSFNQRYGTVMFMQPYERRTESIDSRRECQSALTRFKPGPVSL